MVKNHACKNVLIKGIDIEREKHNEQVSQNVCGDNRIR